MSPIRRKIQRRLLRKRARRPRSLAPLEAILLFAVLIVITFDLISSFSYNEKEVPPDIKAYKQPHVKWAKDIPGIMDERQKINEPASAVSAPAGAAAGDRAQNPAAVKTPEEILEDEIQRMERKLNITDTEKSIENRIKKEQKIFGTKAHPAGEDSVSGYEEQIHAQEKAGRKIRRRYFEIVEDFGDEPVMEFYAEHFELGIWRVMLSTMIYTGADFRKNILPLKIHLTERTPPARPFEEEKIIPISRIEGKDKKGHIYLYSLEKYRENELSLNIISSETLTGNTALIREVLRLLIIQDMDMPAVIREGILSIYPRIIAFGKFYKIFSFGDDKFNHKEIYSLQDAGEKFFYLLFRRSNGGIEFRDIRNFFEADKGKLHMGKNRISAKDIKLIFDRITRRDTSSVFLDLAQECRNSKNPSLKKYAVEMERCLEK